MSFDFRVNIGDWSNDGHNQSDAIIIRSSHEVGEVQDAFITAARKIGVLSNDTYPRFLIADDYDDNRLSDEHQEELTSAGVVWDDLVYIDDRTTPYSVAGAAYIEDAYSMTHLLMRIAQTELQFTYEIVEDSLPNFNGFWDEKLNVSMGYGLYS